MFRVVILCVQFGSIREMFPSFFFEVRRLSNEKNFGFPSGAKDWRYSLAPTTLVSMSIVLSHYFCGFRCMLITWIGFGGWTATRKRHPRERVANNSWRGKTPHTPGTFHSNFPLYIPVSPHNHTIIRFPSSIWNSLSLARSISLLPFPWSYSHT